MLDWFRGIKEEKVKAEVAPKPITRKSLFGTHAGDIESSGNIKNFVLDKIASLTRQQPAFDPNITGMAMDDSSNGYPSFKMYDSGINSVSEAVVYWYASQGFIGAQLCGILAQNWLVNKACAMPGDDAIRKGYNVVSIDGEELDSEAVKIIKSYDRSMRLTWNMREFIRKGRIFGIRVAMFKVQSTDAEYYEKPFNIDGVTPNSYKGIVQVDPYWCAPMLDGASASQPDTLHFYEPTWWIINGKKVHRSHLIIFRHAEPVDVLKPQYIYGGVPLTQQIMERVYAAERVANEAPQLAMSKRTTVWLTDMEAAMSNSATSIERLNYWAQMRDNYGIKLGDKEGDEFSQFDTSLADFDSLIMTQYQLVAAIAGVPATKLIGTTPKGFNSTGEYEEASYHELLESIQTHDLTPLAERHHQLVIKAFVEPQLKVKMNLETTLNWLPLDSPTAEELAQTNLLKAQVGAALIETGAVSSEEERQRIATDKTSGYNEIGIMENESPEGEEQAEEDYLKAEDSKDPCWKGYGQVGMKEKNGKQVPNCVPDEKETEDSTDKFEESKHPRAENGQFGSGGANSSSKKAQSTSHKGSSEKNGSPPPKAGEPFIVYRVAEREGIENRNAGNADGVALHIMNQQNEMGAKTLGNAPDHVYAYRIVPKHDVDAEYQGSSYSKKIEGDKIGRVENKYGIAYSFPEEGYENELIGKVSLEDLKKQSNGQNFDDLGTKAGAELIRKNFESSIAEDAEWEEKKHPRAKNGQFGSGGTSATPKAKEKKSTKPQENKSSGETKSKSQSKSSSNKNEMPVGSNKTDKHGMERSPNLSPRERRIETNFYKKIEKDTPKLIADYKKQFGNVIDPDQVKKLDPNFAKDPSLAAAVHEPSSYLSKVIWRNALQEKADAGDTSPTLFTAGGSGSGKSEAMDLAKAVVGAQEDALTFDSVLGNFKSSTQKIDEALNITEGNVDIIYTNAPLEMATYLNLKRPRTVRLNTIAEAHLKASDNIKKLVEHYKDNPRVKITVVNNAGVPADLSVGKLDDVPSYKPEEMKERITNAAKKLVAEGKIVDKEGNDVGESKLKMLFA